MSAYYETELYIKDFADLLAPSGVGEDILLAGVARGVDPIEAAEDIGGEAIIRVNITFTDVTSEYVKEAANDH